MKRRCRTCNREKPLRLFYSSPKWTCKSCYRKTPAYRARRGRHLQATYGITIDEYETLLAAGDGRCWTCYGGSGVSLAVDHDHETGQIRGLLCKRCNGTLAKIHNRQDILEAMLHYLDNPGRLVNRLLGREALVPDTAGEV